MTLTLFTAGAMGFREESDVQANIYTHGGKIIMTNDTHSVHMHPSEVTSGGQRVGRFANLFWSIYYTSYFFKKYYNPIMKRQGKSGGYLQGIMVYSVLRIYPSFIRLFFILKEKITRINLTKLKRTSKAFKLKQYIHLPISDGSILTKTSGSMLYFPVNG